MGTVVALKTALTLVVVDRYGWHRDTLYYAVAGQHLQGGYVEFPPVTALFSALAHALFGWALAGFRIWPILAGACTVVVAALVARDLGANRRAQTFAAIGVAFSPGILATNQLFQPVSFDQLTTMIVLWLALRLAQGRGSWPLLGVAAGIGLETKYSIAVVLVLLIATFAVWRRDVLRTWGFPIAIGIAALLLVPNLIWEAKHDWISVHWFLHPPPSGSDETRPQYILNVIALTHVVAFPVAVAGVVSLVRDRVVRPLGWTVVGTVVAYFVLGGKSYYGLPTIMFALASGAIPFERWATRRRLWWVGTAYVLFGLALLPITLPVVPQAFAEEHGIVDARGDYGDEVGWPGLVRTVEQHAGGTDVVIASNYGEAGALVVFGHGLPPVASGHVTFRYWRPDVTGREALLVGYGRGAASAFCSGYRVVARISMPVDNDEHDQPVARCTLHGSLADVWPTIVGQYET
ncbi:MAG TPA: glycosyltransferase family 39 protein [Gaiellaceae bacterium]|nr:glycosyltransferase family 39 protein [Gaiellaceae bacterium]